MTFYLSLALNFTSVMYAVALPLTTQSRADTLAYTHTHDTFDDTHRFATDPIFLTGKNDNAGDPICAVSVMKIVKDEEFMIIFHFLYRNTKSVGLNEWPIAIKWDENKPPKRYGMYENLMTFKYEYPYHSFTTTIEENQALEKFIAASRSGDELRIRLFGSNTTSYDFSMANKDIKRLAQFLKIMP